MNLVILFSTMEAKMLRHALAIIIAVALQVTAFLFVIDITNDAVMLYAAGSLVGILTLTVYEMITKK